MSTIIEAFSKSIKQYLNYTTMPWGQLFYTSAWRQIDDHLSSHEISILDIGCGFGISSLEYTRRGCVVTGIEPTIEMATIAQGTANQEGLNTIFHTSTFESANLLEDNYDWIFCHNIFEYCENPKKLLMQISQKQSDKGMLSLIAHNPTAKVMKKAIVNRDPKGAAASIGNNQKFSGIIQTEITIYPLEQLEKWLAECGYEIRKTYGIHNLYGYITDNELKMNTEWNAQMVDLELTLGSLSPYKDIAIFSHIIAKKKI